MVSWQHLGPDGPPPALPPRLSSSYQGIAVIISAVHTGYQRVMPDSFVAPFVGILQPGLEEVEARSEARQHQNRHQQVEGDEPVQEQPRHAAAKERTGWDD